MKVKVQETIYHHKENDKGYHKDKTIVEVAENGNLKMIETIDVQEQWFDTEAERDTAYLESYDNCVEAKTYILGNKDFAFFEFVEDLEEVERDIQTQNENYGKVIDV